MRVETGHLGLEFVQIHHIVGIMPTLREPNSVKAITQFRNIRNLRSHEFNLLVHVTVLLIR